MDNADEDDYFLAEDLAEDELFQNYRVVVDGKVRFYAGFVLRANNLPPGPDGKCIPIGMLFLLDKKPRCEIPEASRQVLKVFAHNIMSHLDLRLVNAKMVKQQHEKIEQAKLEAVKEADKKTIARLAEALRYLSHEARNQLMPVQSIVSKECQEVDPEDMEMLANCTDAIDSMMKNVLLMSKMNPDEEELAKSYTSTECVFSLVSLFRALDNYAEHLLGQLNLTREDTVGFDSSIELTEEAAECLGGKDSKLIAFGNRQYIMQICTNLLSNAIKFTGHGGITLHASVCVAPPSQQGDSFQGQGSDASDDARKLTPAIAAEGAEVSDPTQISNADATTHLAETAAGKQQEAPVSGRPESAAEQHTADTHNKTEADAALPATVPQIKNDTRTGTRIDESKSKTKVATSSADTSMNTTDNEGASPRPRDAASTGRRQALSERSATIARKMSHNYDEDDTFGLDDTTSIGKAHPSTLPDAHHQDEADDEEEVVSVPVSLFAAQQAEFALRGETFDFSSDPLGRSGGSSSFSASGRASRSSSRTGLSVGTRSSFGSSSGGGTGDGNGGNRSSPGRRFRSSTVPLSEMHAPVSPINRSISASAAHAKKGKYAQTRVERKDLGAKLQLRVTVVDTGCGIKEEDIERVMTEFGQARAGAAVFIDGTGLGLPIAKKMAHLLGGSLLLSSVMGEGTTVEVEIPLYEVPEEQGQGFGRTVTRMDSQRTLGDFRWIAEAAAAAKLIRPRHGADLLIVEDSLVQHKLYRQRAEKAQLGIKLVTSGPEALKLIIDEHQRYGAIMLDLYMDGMGGDTVCRNLRHHNYRGVIICVTGNSFSAQERAEFIQEHGFNDVVTKGTTPSPFDMLEELGRLTQAERLS